jgi:oligopeptide/dipeptide ABC transporter ATP-binding protein
VNAPAENASATQPDAGDQELVRVRNLTIRTREIGRQGKLIVDDLSFAVGPGKMTALVGESGAGKSMSAKAVLGALDDRILGVEGDIELCGKHLSGLSRTARRRYVSSVAALVFQNPTRALNPTMRVGPQIAESMRFASGRPRISKIEAKQRSIDLMRQVGIAAPDERYYAFPHQLSGGMKQRAVIAIALSLEPKVLFCDEPTSSLDVTTQALIMDLLEELRETLGLGILFITHDLVLAASRADDVMVLHSGRLVEHLDAASLFESAAMPYTRELIGRIPGGPEEPAASEGSRFLDTSGQTDRCHYAATCPQAGDVCVKLAPPLAELGQQHQCRCWFPVGHPPLAGSVDLLESGRPASPSVH